nr:type II toxin-antitoxin system RelE/ParE family toxin [uncultured Shinella sp.]
MNTVVLLAARADILRQVGYFIEIGQDHVADRFLAATQIAIEELSHTPHAGPLRLMKNPQLSGLRTWSVDGFDDVKIYYVATNEELRIVRVLHGRRDIERILEQ